MSDGKGDKEGGNRTGSSDQFNITQQPQPVERGGRSPSNQQIHAQQQPQPAERGRRGTSSQQKHVQWQPKHVEIHAQQLPQLTIGTRTENPNEVTDTEQLPQLTIGTRTENPNEVTDTQQPPQHGGGIGTDSRFVDDNNELTYTENSADQLGPEETRRLQFQGQENENCARQLLSESIGTTAAHENHPEASCIFQQVPNQPTSQYPPPHASQYLRPLQYPPPHASQYLMPLQYPPPYTSQYLIPLQYPPPYASQYLRPLQYPPPYASQCLIPLQNPPLVFPTNFTSTSCPAHHANQHPNSGTVSNITSTSHQPGPNIFQGRQDENCVRQDINLLPGSNFASRNCDSSSHSSQDPEYTCAYCRHGMYSLTHEGRDCGHVCHLHCFNSLPVEVQQSNETCPVCRTRSPTST